MTSPIEIQSLRPLMAGKPRISALFSFRHDVALVPGLLQNLAPLVHDALLWDDRGGHELHSNEPVRRNALLAAARALGSDWILAVDPDERFETALAGRMEELTADPARQVLWSFALREMFTPTAWRADGVWGGKSQMRLFPIHAVQGVLARDLHGRWVEPDKGYRNRPTGLNLYHFHHLSAEKGQARRDAYAKADPERRHNAIGYDYLADRRGMVLQEVPPDHGYQPKWLVALPEAVPVMEPSPAADPVHARLRLIERALHQKGRAAAALWANDLAAQRPEDEDLSAVAAILGPPVGDQAPDLWRRWIKGGARLHEGAANGRGPLTVIVLGFRAQKELRPTLQALVDQSGDAEIVVVNSGGGNMGRLLGPLIDRVRLIEVEEPLFVGAARNIGIDASQGQWVSFLAGDCAPEPGWVAGRLARHAAGAVSVATAVVPRRPGSLIAGLVWSWRFFARDPSVNPERASLYGRSYERQALLRLGYFAPALRQGEDGEFNSRLDRMEPCVWAPEIVVRHADPLTFLGAILDTWRRAKRMRPPVGLSQVRAWQRFNRRCMEMREMVLPAALRLGVLGRLMMPLARWAYVKAYEIPLRRSLPAQYAAEGLRRKAALALDQGKPEALALAFKAVAQDPESAAIWQTLGDCRARFAKPGALEAWQKALNIEPTRAAALCFAVDHLLEQGAQDQALAVAEQAVTVAPADPALRRIAARGAAKAPNRALDHLRNALAYAPADADLHEELAALHDVLGNKALAALRRSTAKALLDTTQRPG